MAAKDFQELIKAQMETTRALLSAEEAKRYDTIISEKQLQFDKNNEKARKAAETRRDNATKKAEDGNDESTQIASGTEKSITQLGPTVTKSLENLRKEQKDAKKIAGGAFKSDKKYQDVTQEINKLEGIQVTAGLKGASLLQAQVALLGNNLGEFASDSKEYQKKSYQAQIATLNERLANPDLSSSAREEIENEKTALAKKQGGFLGKIAEGVGGLKEGVKNAKKNAGKGVMAILKGTLIAGFALAMVAFLNSKYWEDTKKVIVEDILPGVQKFFGFLKENALAISVGFAAIVAVLAIAKVLGYLQKIKLAFIAVKAAFLAMKVFMMSTLLPTITAALAPLVPFIAIGVAIAAAIAILIGGVMAAFEDFQKTLKETGSISEALKVGAAKFIGFILGIIPDLVLKLVGFVAGLFGFDDFKKKVSTIDPIQFIADAFKDMFDKIQAFFGRLFTNPVAAINQLIGDTLTMYTDFGGFIYRKVLKPAIDWIGNLFGVTDASGQLEGFVGDKLNKILNFAAEIYEQYIKPIVDWVSDLFSKVASPVGAALSNAADMAKNFIKTVLRSVLPKPGGSLFSIAGIASKAIPKGVYEFAGLNPETGDLIAPAVGGGDLKPTTDGRAQQINEAGVARSGGGGGTVVVDAKSANVVNSNSSSSATFTSTNLTNSNPTVAQLALSY